MKIYINGTGVVAPQETLNHELFLEEIAAYETNRLQIIAPNYREYISPKSLRRMSKIVRMSVVSALVALKDAGKQKTDAIITATGMGCQTDTEKFLNSMLDNNESVLNPTAFIQSTHNTMGAQVALLQGSNGYNLTYVHRTFSFESALLDGLMMLKEKEASSVLLGGIDEITEESWLIKTRLGYYKKEAVNNLDLYTDSQPGALAGESSAFFVLSPEPNERSYAEIAGTSIFYKPKNQGDITSKILSFLSENETGPETIDLLISGYNGDLQFDPVYQSVENDIFSNASHAYYKHLCGEHDTASAFAMWIASRILKNNTIPETIKKGGEEKGDIRTILIYNHFRNINHSLILLKKAF